MVEYPSFFPGRPVPPKQFIGRRHSILAAFAQIQNRSNFALWGGPGLGKSSFLQLFTHREFWQSQGYDSTDAIIIYFSCLDIRPFKVAEFWRKVLNYLRKKLHGEPYFKSHLESLEKKTEITGDDLEQVLEQIGRTNRYLLLLLDDYDVALHPHEEYTEVEMENFLSQCRYLAYSSPQSYHLSMVVSSLRPLNELGPPVNPGQSPWYDHYYYEPLKPFTPKEVDSFWEGISMTEELRQAIAKIAGGHPALLQNAGFLL